MILRQRHLTKRCPAAYWPGLRNCVGMRFALIELKMCLGLLLRQFTILPGDKIEQIFEQDEILVIRPKIIERNVLIDIESTKKTEYLFDRIYEKLRCASKTNFSIVEISRFVSILEVLISISENGLFNFNHGYAIRVQIYSL